jgi:hypothetical protein
MSLKSLLLRAYLTSMSTPRGGMPKSARYVLWPTLGSVSSSITSSNTEDEPEDVLYLALGGDGPPDRLLETVGVPTPAAHRGLEAPEDGYEVRPAEDRLVDARIEDRGDHPVDKGCRGDGQLVRARSRVGSRSLVTSALNSARLMPAGNCTRAPNMQNPSLCLCLAKSDTQERWCACCDDVGQFTQ